MDSNISTDHEPSLLASSNTATVSLQQPFSNSSKRLNDENVEEGIKTRQQMSTMPVHLRKQWKSCTNCKVFHGIEDGKSCYKLKCHCGREANISRARNLKSHYESEHCVRETRSLSRHNGGIVSFFKRPAASEAGNPPPTKRPTLESKSYPCAGLNDESWDRPRKKEGGKAKAMIAATIVLTVIVIEQCKYVGRKRSDDT